MDFFTKVTRPTKATQETVYGLKGQNSFYTYVTPAGVFETRSEAMQANNCTQDQLISRCERTSFPDWSRKLKPAFADSMSAFTDSMSRSRVGKPNCNAKPVMTYYGQYPSVEAVAKAAGVTGNVVRRWIKKYPKHYYFVTKGE
jgi:hypothetical protein